ncbi:hypothetical protein F0562_025502 [Nyssa sinensis]|uniref:Uncharacterized protein n=1 Tax=Nyssa sinensis TaxID=561372 RepID=A0A5J5B8L7_9ASTE|nr:hypothetical protein F0562_025502 [Nyssa sinensis]
MAVFGPRVDRGWGFCGWVDGESYGQSVKFLWLSRSVGLFESSSDAEEEIGRGLEWEMQKERGTHAAELLSSHGVETIRKRAAIVVVELGQNFQQMLQIKWISVKWKIGRKPTGLLISSGMKLVFSSIPEVSGKDRREVLVLLIWRDIFLMSQWSFPERISPDV